MKHAFDKELASFLLPFSIQSFVRPKFISRRLLKIGHFLKEIDLKHPHFVFPSWDYYRSIKVLYCASNSVGTKSISQGISLQKISHFCKKTKNSQVLIFLSWGCHFSMKVIYCASNSVGTKYRSQGRRPPKKSAIFCKKSTKNSPILIFTA